MSNINFNSIYDGVTLALHAAFPKCKVHGGDVRQGLSTGDFNVVMPGANHTKEVGHRYRRTPSLDVLYYPKARPCAAECYDVAHQLMRGLSAPAAENRNGQNSITATHTHRMSVAAMKT